MIIILILVIIIVIIITLIVVVIIVAHGMTNEIGTPDPKLEPRINQFKQM